MNSPRWTVFLAMCAACSITAVAGADDSMFEHRRALMGDLTGDGVVDVGDLRALLKNYGAEGDIDPLQGDLNGDGVIDREDVRILLSMFGDRVDDADVLASLAESGLLDEGLDDGSSAFGDHHPSVSHADHTPAFSESHPNHHQGISGLWDHPNPHNVGVSSGWPPNHTKTSSNTIPPGHGVIQSNQWPPNHTPHHSDGWQPPGDHMAHVSMTWPPGHDFNVSQTVPPGNWDHNEHTSGTWDNFNDPDENPLNWPNNHHGFVSILWPDDHDGNLSATWPPSHLVAVTKSWQDNNHQQAVSATWPPNYHSEQYSETPFGPPIDFRPGWPVYTSVDDEFINTQE